jgi:hypothetical protein
MNRLRGLTSSPTTVEAEPLTGKTHQIRVHAAESGFPILGDTLYGGTPAARVFLHAAEISFIHPATGKPVTFHAPANFDADPRLALRAALIDPQETDAFRVIHGASDGWPGWYVERLGKFLLSQSEQPLRAEQREELARLAKFFPRAGRITKSCRGRCGARPQPRHRRNWFGAKPRRSGLRFARTASVSNWVSTKAIPRDCFWTSATTAAAF